MVVFNFYVKEYRVVVHEGGSLVNRLGDSWGCLQHEEGAITGLALFISN